MRFLDILDLSLGNLKRRKFRTFLTVLGVIIGSTSVILMMALGLGLKDSIRKEFEQFGSMKDVQVSSNSSERYFTEDMIAEYESLDMVDSVSAHLSTTIVLSQGKWQVMMELTGLSDEELENIRVDGRVTSANADEMELIIGNEVNEVAMDITTGVYRYESDKKEDGIDFTDTVYTQFYDEDSEIDRNAAGVYVFKNKKNTFPVVGVMPVEAGYTQYSYGIYTSNEILKDYLKKAYKGRLIPDQPTDKNGNPLKELVYSSIVVHARSLEDVDAVTAYFQDLGYSAYAMASDFKETEKVFGIVQIILGAIGAIALLVAAIGIANTMTMSTYERTKEIGVMKVLGCSLKNIRSIFLTEAAFIGFMGGLGGVIISGLIAFIANSIVGPELAFNMFGIDEMSLMIMPLWLVIGAVGFATLVGTLAGFFPAQRAMRLSPLAAIRNE